MNEFEQRTFQVMNHAAYGASGEYQDNLPIPKNVNSYITRVIEDACASEDRPNDVRFECQLLPDQVLLFSIKTNYLRVQRRILYRLHKNLKKNFGIRFNLLRPYPGHCGVSGIREEAIYDTYPISQGVDPNHSCLLITVFGKHYTLRSLYGIRPDEELGIPHLDKLKEHGFDFQAKYSPEEVWDIFLNAYVTAYGELPLKEAIVQEKYYQGLKAQKDAQEKKDRIAKINDDAKNLEACHKRQYEKDEEIHGCGYWSVCDDRACPCSPDAPVSKGFSEEVWQSLASEPLDE